MYHFCGGCLDAEVVDRVLINMDLSISPHFTERRTYSGIHNISQFDLSFRISGDCSENYYGPQCNVFCGPQCRAAAGTTTSSPAAIPAAIVGGVVGGIAGVFVLVLLVVLLLCCLLGRGGGLKKSGII